MDRSASIRVAPEPLPVRRHRDPRLLTGKQGRPLQARPYPSQTIASTWRPLAAVVAAETTIDHDKPHAHLKPYRRAERAVKKRDLPPRACSRACSDPWAYAAISWGRAP